MHQVNLSRNQSIETGKNFNGRCSSVFIVFEQVFQPLGKISVLLLYVNSPTSIYLFKVNNGNTRTMFIYFKCICR